MNRLFFLLFELFLAGASLNASAQYSSNIVKTLNNETKAEVNGHFVSMRYEKNRLFLLFPHNYLDKPILLSSCISSSSMYKWLEVGTRNVGAIYAKFSRVGSMVYLQHIHTEMVGEKENKNAMSALADSHSTDYIASFRIIGNAKDTLTIDVTDLFLGDKVLPSFPKWFNKAKTTFREDLSYIENMKSFDDNFSVKVLRTYDYSNADDNSSGKMSAEIVHTVLLLPEKKMRPRLTDDRIGIFSENKTSFDVSKSDFYQPISYCDRWRIEPSDWTAWKRGGNVKPLKPIVYYIDNKFPENWKEPIRKGILLWNKAFEEIGLKDVIEVKDYPINDLTFDPDNLKYNCIRYIPTDRGGAQGPSWVDPSTGEIISSSVYVWATVAEYTSKFCFVQTAQYNKSIRSGKLVGEDLDIGLQNVIAHEIGHTLGLAHNMCGSAAYPIDSLLNNNFVWTHGLTASTMDYIYYDYIVPPETINFHPSSVALGPYDKLAIKYIYEPTDQSLEIDEDALEAKTWVDKHAGDVKYRYSEQQWQNPIDPSNIIYDIGDDAIKASTMGIKNLKYVLSHINEWLAGSSNNYVRQKMYEELLNQYQRMITNVLYNIGGLRLSHHHTGTPGIAHEPIKSNIQKNSLKFVANEIFHSSWIDNHEVISDFPYKEDASIDILEKIAEALIDRIDNVRKCVQLSRENAYTEKKYNEDLYNVFFKKPSFEEVSSITADKFQCVLVNNIFNKNKTESFVVLLEKLSRNKFISTNIKRMLKKNWSNL